MGRFACFLVHRRFLVALGMLSLTGVATYGLLYHPPPQAPGNLRDDVALRSRGASFDLPRPDALLVIEVEDLFRRETVTALRSMARAIEQLDYVASLN